jgi:hypothetical protein
MAARTIAKLLINAYWLEKDGRKPVAEALRNQADAILKDVITTQKIIQSSNSRVGKN